MSANGSNIETAKEAARRFCAPMLAKGYRPQALHEYRSASGEVLFYRIRAKHPGTGEKFIRPMHRNGASFELGEPEFPSGKPLYRLDELAAKPGAPCWWCEGERCADALAKLGVLATTAGSAQSDERADFSPLARRTVTIWPDANKPGLEHAERVAAKLRALGCSVERIDAQTLGLPEGGDVVDWLRGRPNANAADLARLPRLKSSAQADKAGPGAAKDDRRLELIPIGKLLAEPQETTRWLVEGLLPAGGISILAARPKVGKSTLARHLALCAARGASFMERTVTKGAVFILDLEGKRGETVNALRELGATEQDAIKVFCGMAPKGAFDQLREAALADHPALIIIDTMQRLARIANLNDYSEVSIALDSYIALARETGAHVLLLHHQGRSEGSGVDAPMGSTAISGSVDTILTMRRRKDHADTRTLSSVQRYGSDLEETVVTMGDRGELGAGGLVRDHDLRDAGERIIEYLKGNPGAEQSDIKEGVEGRWTVVRNALTELVKSGRVSKTGAGKKGDAHKYWFSSSRGSQEPAEPEKPEFRPPASGSEAATGDSPEVL